MQPERHSAPAATGALVDSSGTSISGVGGGNKGGTATVAAGTKQAAQSSAIVSASARRSGGSSGGGGTKDNHDRRAKLLADLGDGTVLVSWATTGVEEVLSNAIATFYSPRGGRAVALESCEFRAWVRTLEHRIIKLISIPPPYLFAT